MVELKYSWSNSFDLLYLLIKEESLGNENNLASRKSN
jgi:hypothetical protein